MTGPTPTILIVEDEAKMRRLLELDLGDDGFQTLSAEDAELGLKLLQNNSVDLVITDLKLPGMNGLEFLQAVKRFQEALPVVVMTAFGTVETAVEAMKAGASDYVLKPFSLDEMRMVVHKELDVQRLRVENRSLREALQHRYQHPNLVARSARMQEVLATVERVAPTNSTVMRSRGGRRDHLSRSTAPQFPKTCWRANSSVMRRVRSPALLRASQGNSN
jgi:two-component system NtrC family response regulator